jgi:hypothetical protein
VVYYDIDGCLRDLAGAVCGKTPDTYEYQNAFGEGFCDIVDKNLHFLLEAKPTIYYPIVRMFCPITIITCQPELWIPNTAKWLMDHFKRGEIRYVEVVGHPKDKLKLLKEGDFLVEDYPMFDDYSQIILIDHPYNQNVHAKIIVKSPEHLLETLRNV